MIYRALDDAGDYTFGGNGNSYITDADAARQAVVTRLRQLIYEWWEQLEDGLPLWQKILASRDKDAAEKIIRERIENTDHVKTILSFNPSWDNKNRSLTITATIETEYGVVSINEVM